MVMMVAILAIGVSAGMLLERWRRERRAGAEYPRAATAAVPGERPRLVPDRMPEPVPREPVPRPSPAPDRTPPPDPSSPSGGSPNDAELFATALSNSLCDKLSECGLMNGNTQPVCRLFAQTLQEEAPAARVRRGECSYDGNAAEQCLDAIDALECDATRGTEVLDWLLAASSLKTCAAVFTCD